MNGFESITINGVTINNFIFILVSSLFSGIVVSLIYLFTHKKENFNYSMPVTLMVLPIVVSLVLSLVGDNVAGAFSLMGVFSLIRFRSEQGSLKDIAYIFISVACGLAMGLGYVAYGAVVCIFLSVVLLLASLIKFGEPKKNRLKLRIIVPENLNYEDAFDDILEKYTNGYYLDKVRTTDFGTMFELSYMIIVPKDFCQKNFIDELRCRNSNLNITLTLSNKVQEF